MAYVKKKTVLPIYLVGFVWLAWGLFGSLYRLRDYVLCAAVSCAAYFLGKIIWPDRGYEAAGTQQTQSAAKAEEKPKADPKPAYSPEIQALIGERDKALGEMRRLNASIKDPQVSADIDHLERTAGKIIDAVVAEPAKLPQIRKFMNYYLPTTLKLLNAYDRMAATGASGTNIDGTKTKVEDMLFTICAAFDKQLDALYGEEALDISTDITVMEQMLAREGLGGMTMESGQQ